MSHTSFLNAALSYTLRGLAVVPLHGKVPITEHGYNDATLDAKIIRQWWGKEYPEANIGIAVSKQRGIICIEADCHREEEDGLKALEYLQEQHGALPETLMALSGGGGIHHYFRFPKDADIRNQKIPGFPGLEVKANGGMCAPPSIHSETGHDYVWIEEDAPIADLPCWLRTLIETPVVIKGSGHAGIDQAIGEKDERALYSYAQDIIQFDERRLARLKLDIRKIFGASFPMREFNELLKAEQAKRQEQEQVSNLPVPKSVYELMNKKFAPINWIIEDVLPEGLIALAGKQKIGKSWFDLGISLAVAQGGIALGSIKVQQGDVLYLALEDNERRLQDRIGQLLAPGESVPKNFYYYEQWPRMDSYGIAALEKFIKDHPQLRLIIVDPWVKVKPSVKQKAGNTGYDADYESLEGLKRLSDTYHLCILVQFHLRKAGADDPLDELNATTGVSACADGTLILKRGRGEADATLWGTGRDYKQEVDLALSFENGFWKTLGNATAYSLSKERKAIIDVLNEAGQPLQPKEIAKLLDKADGSIRKMLFDMKNKGEVKETQQGYISCIDYR